LTEFSKEENEDEQ